MHIHTVFSFPEKRRCDIVCEYLSETINSNMIQDFTVSQSAFDKQWYHVSAVSDMQPPSHPGLTSVIAKCIERAQSFSDGIGWKKN